MKPHQHELSITKESFNLIGEVIRVDNLIKAKADKLRAVDLPGPKPPADLKAHEQTAMQL